MFLLQEVIGHYKNTCSETIIKTIKQYKSNTRFFYKEVNFSSQPQVAKRRC